MIFSLQKSTYNLALNLKERKKDIGQSSGEANVDRRLWNAIFKCFSQDVECPFSNASRSDGEDLAARTHGLPTLPRARWRI